VQEKLYWGKFKGTAIRNVPNILTMGNLFLGMLALLYLLDKRYELSISLILIAMVLDGLDGKIATTLKVESELGKQLDSLCDLVSFGVVPAVIIYSISLSQFGFIGFIVAALFPLAGAYRLAKFNLGLSSGPGFTGLPITVAGGTLAALALHSIFYLTWIAPIFTFLLALLMVSKVKYPAIKKGEQERNSFLFIIFYTGILSFIFFVIFRREVIFYFLLSYIVFGILSRIYLKIKSREEAPCSLTSDSIGN